MNNKLIPAKFFSFSLVCLSTPMVRTANTARKQVSRMSNESKEPKKKIPSSQQGNIAEKRPAKSLSVSVPTISQKPKPQPKKVAKNIMKEIKYYQNNIGFLVPRALIVRIVRQSLLNTLKSKVDSEYKFTSVSLNIIHEAIENHIVYLLELSYMAARHAKRVTLFPSDIRLINRIRGAGTQ